MEWGSISVPRGPISSSNAHIEIVVMLLWFCFVGYGSSYYDYLILLRFTCSFARLNVVIQVLYTCLGGYSHI